MCAPYTVHKVTLYLHPCEAFIYTEKSEGTSCSFAEMLHTDTFTPRILHIMTAAEV